MGTNKKKYLTYLAWFGFVLAFLMLARYLHSFAVTYVRL